jgi:hypothetical protein
MRSRLRDGISFANVTALLALVLALSGGAYAATATLSAKGKSVKACAARHGGALRLKGSHKCRHGERKLTWSKTGPQGLQGLPGAKGNTGPRGLQGPKGSTGAQGPAGPTASSFASSSTTGAIGGAPAVIASLTTSPGNGGPLHMTFAGRVVANGYAVLSNHIPATPNAYERESCALQIQRVGDVAWTVMGAPTDVDLPYNSSIDVQQGVPLTGAVDEPAGDYDVRILCTPANNSDQIHKNGGGITVIATQ